MELLETPSREVLVQRGPSVGYVGPSMGNVRIPKASMAQGYVLLHRGAHGAWQTFRIPAKLEKTARATAGRVARKTNRKIILGELVQVAGMTQVIRSVAIYETMSKAELFARAAAAAGEVARIYKAKESDPYDPRQFDKLTDDLARDLNRVASPAFVKTVEGVVDSAKIDWATATEKQMDAFSAKLATALGVSATAVWKSIGPMVTEASVTMATEARSAFVKTHNLTIDRAISLKDKAAVARSAQTNAHYVRVFSTKQMSPSLSSQARGIVQAGIDKGQSSRVIGNEMHRVLGKATGGQTQAYFRMAASAINGRSREFSSLRSMQDAGIEKYEWSSVLDEATTETCFSAGTSISVPGGEIPIEQISPGDLVVTGSGGFHKVIDTQVRPSGGWLLIRLSSGRQLTVTENHPILSVNGWIRAHKLRPGTEVATGKMRELPEGFHVKVADQREGVGSVLFPRMLLGMGSSSQSERGCVCGLRGAICFSKAPERGLDEVLLPAMLSNGQEKKRLGGSGLRALWIQFQCAADLCGAWAVPLLQQQVSAPGQQSRSGSEAPSEVLRGVRAGVHDFSRGVSGRQGQAPLLQEVLFAATDDDLRAVWDRVRGEDGLRKKAPVLFGLLLPQIKDSQQTRDANQGDLAGLRGRVRGRSTIQRPLRSGNKNSSCGLSPDWPRGGTGIRRRVLARPETERASRGPQDTAGERGWFDTDSGPAGGHRERAREIPVEDYLACSPGFVTVESVTRITDGPKYCYNLQVETDPTYVAEGVVAHNCRFLDGQVFSVQGALDRYAAADALKDPTDVKYEMPWFYDKPIRGGEHDGKMGIFMNQRGGMVRVAVVEKAGFGKPDAIGKYSNTKSAKALEGMGMPACPGHGH